LADEELEKIKQKKLEGVMKKMTEEKKASQVAGNKPCHLSDHDFDDKITGAKVALVDFYADWCGPCRMMAPTIDVLTNEYSGKVLVAKVNVDENPMLAQKFGITSIPTFGIFKGAKLIGTIVGAVGKDPLKKALDKALRSQ
jgi:thioredoxin 1